MFPGISTPSWDTPGCSLLNSVQIVGGRAARPQRKNGPNLANRFLLENTRE
jgi:hypothetical protein